jgi:ElaB/YqjD/DUF883 family membrane-anchored ribosome-binding protein
VRRRKKHQIPETLLRRAWRAVDDQVAVISEHTGEGVMLAKLLEQAGIVKDDQDYMAERLYALIGQLSQDLMEHPDTYPVETPIDLIGHGMAKGFVIGIIIGRKVAELDQPEAEAA